jgi:phosphoribosylformylglycinamidine (FGAM) synthase PurS component
VHYRRWDTPKCREEAKTQVERIAKDVLTNPVIEEFRFEILE